MATNPARTVHSVRKTKHTLESFSSTLALPRDSDCIVLVNSVSSAIRKHTRQMVNHSKGGGGGGGYKRLTLIRDN